MKQNKPHASALDLIEVLNDISNAILLSEQENNEFELGRHQNDSDPLFDYFDIHFCDSREGRAEVGKAVLEVLINSMYMTHQLSLVNEDDFSSTDYDCGDQLEFDF